MTIGEIKQNNSRCETAIQILEGCGVLSRFFLNRHTWLSVSAEVGPLYTALLDAMWTLRREGDQILNSYDYTQQRIARLRQHQQWLQGKEKHYIDKLTDALRDEKKLVGSVTSLPDFKAETTVLDVEKEIDSLLTALGAQIASYNSNVTEIRKFRSVSSARWIMDAVGFPKGSELPNLLT